MSQMGYGDSLVRYSTERRDRHEAAHWLRPRLVGYASLIVVMLGLFGFALTQRVPLGLDVKRDRNRLYREFWDGSVENVYTLRISNRGSEPRDYRIGFESELPLEVHGDRVVRVDPGKLQAVPIRLTLPGGSPVAANTAEVRFSVEATGDPSYVVDKTSLFHLPHAENGERGS